MRRGPWFDPFPALNTASTVALIDTIEKIMKSFSVEADGFMLGNLHSSKAHLLSPLSFLP